MTVKARRKREKEQLRESILQEATRAFLEEGYEKASMRKIAQRIEYSVGTLYLYFKNKDELFYAVQGVAFQAFFNYMQSVASIENPLDRMQQLGKTYIKFALENPEYYSLMFILQGPMNALEDTDAWATGIATHDIVQQAVQDCIDQGYFYADNAEDTAFMFWSLVHGMASLQNSCRMRMYDEADQEAMMQRVMDLIHGAMQRKP